MSNIEYRIFRIKWSSWEYWPAWLANLPVGLIWLWFSLRARHFFFFSTVNPAIPSGGVLGESKMDILRRIPSRWLPATIFVEPKTNFQLVLEKMTAAGIQFPCIAKPDVGERGFLVKKCETAADLAAHLARFPIEFIVQEFLAQPMEVSVLYHRFPDEKTGRVTSFCVKEFLSVVGDGRSTVRQLLLKNDRAILQLARLEKERPEMLEKIPSDGERLRVESVGNHCKGTKFLNANSLIDNDLHQIFDEIARPIEGVFYGRFDMKIESVELLKKGIGCKIMELNGVASDPAHVFDPSFGPRRAYLDYFKHWKIIYEISRVQRAKGIRPMTFSEARRAVRDYRAYHKRMQLLMA